MYKWLKVRVRAAMARRGHESLEDNDNLDELDSPAEIETGRLAIQTNEPAKNTQKEIWQRPASAPPRYLPEPGSHVLNFEILRARINPPEGEDLKVKRYVVYDLSVRHDTATVSDASPITISRRFTDFRNLYLQLRHEFPNFMNSIYFPSRVLVGNFTGNLIAERSVAFENFLHHIVTNIVLRESPAFLHFLQDAELTKACQLLDERRNEVAIPLLEKCFYLLSKIFMDHSRPVLLILCRLVAACTTTAVPHPSAERWATVALLRYDTLCDIDLLQLYIPLLNTCSHLWWQRGLERKPIDDRLAAMSRKGIDIKKSVPLTQAIHKLDPRTETI